MEQTLTNDVKNRQDPLRARYRKAPHEAWITDSARTANAHAADAFHGAVSAGAPDGASWEFGIHRAVGGDHDLPNPGDILCASLAACLDTTLRMIAGRMDIALDVVDVSVSANVDVRGCLMVDPEVPVGFTRIDAAVQIHAQDGTDAERMQVLIATAERCCVILQTLRGEVPVHTTIGSPSEATAPTRPRLGR